jgi:acyl-[acyl-carrier-protein] desaturase
VADQLLARIALDENLHMLFYRNLLGAALEVSPNQTMRAITEVVRTFEMPGHSIENFTRKSVQIAMSGIYDLRIHRDDVLAPVLRAWGVFDLKGLDADGEAARTELAEALDGLDQAASRFEEKRDAHREKMAARGHRVDIV